MEWARARSVEQKEIRIDAILEAAALLFDKNDIANITITDIAKQAKFTRSNLYKYFKTKEDIFLQLVLSDIISWHKDLDKQFLDKSDCELDDFIESWIEVDNKHIRMRKLFPLLYTYLERHCTLDSLIEFKRRLMLELKGISSTIIRVLPALNQGKVVTFLNMQIAFSSGLHPMTDPNEKQLVAIEKGMPEYSIPDFNEYFRRFLYSILEELTD